MFRAEIEFKGKHALYMKSLIDDHNIFKYNVDILMAAPVLGFYYNRKESEDENDEHNHLKRKIGMQALLNREEKLTMIYRLIILLSDSDEQSLSEQIDKTFRYDSNENFSDEHQKNVDLFFSYVRGGISILYEKLLQNSITQEDIYQSMTSFINEYYTEMYVEAPTEEDNIKLAFQ